MDIHLILKVIITKTKRIGLIAQELQEVYPELVTKSGEESTLSVDYNGMIPLLVESVSGNNNKESFFGNNSYDYFTIGASSDSVSSCNKSYHILDSQLTDYFVDKLDIVHLQFDV